MLQYATEANVLYDLTSYLLVSRHSIRHINISLTNGFNGQGYQHCVIEFEISDHRPCVHGVKPRTPTNTIQ